MVFFKQLDYSLTTEPRDSCSFFLFGRKGFLYIETIHALCLLGANAWLAISKDYRICVVRSGFKNGESAGVENGSEKGQPM